MGSGEEDLGTVALDTVTLHSVILLHTNTFNNHTHLYRWWRGRKRGRETGDREEREGEGGTVGLEMSSVTLSPCAL